MWFKEWNSYFNQKYQLLVPTTSSLKCWNQTNTCWTSSKDYWSNRLESRHLKKRKRSKKIKSFTKLWKTSKCELNTLKREKTSRILISLRRKSSRREVSNSVRMNSTRLWLTPIRIRIARVGKAKKDTVSYLKSRLSSRRKVNTALKRKEVSKTKDPKERKETDAEPPRSQ